MDGIKHSGVGIASFVTSIVFVVLMVVAVLSAGVLATSAPGGLSSTSPAAILLGLVIILALIGALVALGLGIGGLVQQSRKTIFAVPGTVISVATLIAIGLLMALGLAAS